MEVISKSEAKARGLKHYFTGKPCKRSHLYWRSISGHCVLCERLRARNYKDRNREDERERSRQYAARNRQKRRVQRREYQIRKPTHYRDYERNRYATNPQYAFRKALRSRLGSITRQARTRKIASTIELVGCSYIELMRYLESKFAPGMSWENRNQWEIDHIRPCASYDLTDPTQQRECFHYTNLQPMWIADHRKKTKSDVMVIRNRSAS